MLIETPYSWNSARTLARLGPRTPPWCLRGMLHSITTWASWSATISMIARLAVFTYFLAPSSSTLLYCRIQQDGRWCARPRFLGKFFGWVWHDYERKLSDVFDPRPLYTSVTTVSSKLATAWLQVAFGGFGFLFAVDGNTIFIITSLPWEGDAGRRLAFWSGMIIGRTEFAIFGWTQALPLTTIWSLLSCYERKLLHAIIKGTSSCRLFASVRPTSWYLITSYYSVALLLRCSWTSKTATDTSLASLTMLQLFYTKLRWHYKEERFTCMVHWRDKTHSELDPHS